MKSIAIIGGGAAGLMVASTIDSNNARITLYESRASIGKKILVTGNGHCNITNTDLNYSNYYDINDTFLDTVFQKFDNSMTIEYFNNLGIKTRNKNGYIYPYSYQAASVLSAFKYNLSKSDIDIRLNSAVLHINRFNKKWNIITEKSSDSFDSLIIACGSPASNKADQNQTIYNFLKKTGHTFIDFKPSLTYLKTDDKNFLKISSGVRFPVKIQLIINNKLIDTEVGELQITQRGISGICIFSLSRYISRNNYKKAECIVDFLPDISNEQLNLFIFSKLDYDKNINIYDLLNGLIPDKLISAIANYLKICKNELLESQKDKLLHMIYLIKNYKFIIKGTGDICDSQVCTGGVSIKDIDPNTMMSNISNNLFFAGEIIDVDGKCGGYNLQWAWSSGYIAAINAVK